MFPDVAFLLFIHSQTINNLSESSVSLARVQGFLLAEEIEVPSRDNRESTGISLSNGHFLWKTVLRSMER